jgi:hypothetical protein
MDTIEASGRTAKVRLDGNLLTLTPTALAKVGGRRGEVQLRVDTLTGVQLSPAHFGTLGFIRFVTSGSPATVDRQTAQRDPYTVVFGRGDGAAFAAIRDAVMARIAGS